MNIAVAFICANYNKYSINALAGAIESTPSVATTPLYFVREKNPAGIVATLGELQARYDRLLVCFSFATTNIVPVYKLLSALRGTLESPGLTFVAGGPHATGDPLGALTLGFDVVVIGEGEVTFPELLGAFSAGSDWRSIKGIAFIEQGAMVATGKRRPVDLNRFAPFSPKHRRLSPIEVSRGCPHACRFCQTSYIFGGRMRHRNLDEVLKYLTLGKAGGTCDFRFISPNALAYASEDGITVNLAAIEELLRAASKITGTKHLFFGSFPSEVRPEAVSQEALELITGFTATKQVVVGAQTGSQRMLDLLHRKHTVEDVYNAVKLILAAGLEVSVDFIFGLPDETEADRKLSVKMMDDLAALGAKIHSHAFIPLPGTPLHTASAGVVDDELARYLSRLANKGLQFGQWKKHQKLAAEACGFRPPAPESSNIKPS